LSRELDSFNEDAAESSFVTANSDEDREGAAPIVHVEENYYKSHRHYNSEDQSKKVTRTAHDHAFVTANETTNLDLCATEESIAGSKSIRTALSDVFALRPIDSCVDVSPKSISAPPSVSLVRR